MRSVPWNMLWLVPLLGLVCGCCQATHHTRSGTWSRIGFGESVSNTLDTDANDEADFFAVSVVESGTLALQVRVEPVHVPFSMRLRIWDVHMELLLDEFIPEGTCVLGPLTILPDWVFFEFSLTDGSVRYGFTVEESLLVEPSW